MWHTLSAADVSTRGTGRLAGAAGTLAALQGYLAHEKQPPPPRTTTGP